MGESPEDQNQSVEVKQEEEEEEEVEEVQEQVDEEQGQEATQPPYLGIFFVATAGQNGPNLGSDEEEVVLLVLSILDTATNQVVCTCPYVVQPRTADINENLLSDECKIDFKLSDDQVKNAIALETAVEKLDQVIQLQTLGRDFTLVVDGQLPLRQCLHPEACAKNISLPDYYNSFYDLRKEFSKRFGAEAEGIGEMVEHLGLGVSEENEDPLLLQVNQMTRIVQRILSEGLALTEKEVVQMKLEPGICSKFEEVDSDCVVRARGLPWQSSDQDIAKFFRGLNIAKGGVALCLSVQGRRNGEALVRFESPEHRDMALKRHKHHIATRYIEVYKATGEDFINVAGGSNNEAQAFLSKGGQVIVRMRGLPYDCTAKQVIEFFESGENGCKTLDGEEGVLFVRRADGRATGDAFVLFEAEEDASKALSKHKESIGSRYIELFRSTTAEVQQVLNRCIEPKTAEVPPQLPLVTPVASVAQQVAPVPQVAVPILPQHIITSGTRKDCIRLRGLPYEAQVEHVLEFLGENAENIVYQGVHMVYNPQGQPSGEAFIQMNSEHSAFMAAHAKHHQFMTIAKKKRYIEVFQCSGDDMNHVLTGGMPSPPKGIVSPGMLSPSSGATLIPTAAMNAHSFSPLSPQQASHQHQIMRHNQMAAAIAASMRPNMNQLAAAAAAAAAQQHQQQQQQHHHHQHHHNPHLSHHNPNLLNFLNQINLQHAQLSGGGGHHQHAAFAAAAAAAAAAGLHQPGILGSAPGASAGLMGSPPGGMSNLVGLPHGTSLPSPLPSPTPEEVALQRAHLMNPQLFQHHHQFAAHLQPQQYHHQMLLAGNFIANASPHAARASPPAPRQQHLLLNGGGFSPDQAAMAAALNQNGGKRGWDDMFNGIEAAVVSAKRMRPSHVNGGSGGGGGGGGGGNGGGNAAVAPGTPAANGVHYGYPPKSPGTS